jgi:hypothetical protein
VTRNESQSQFVKQARERGNLNSSKVKELVRLTEMSSYRRELMPAKNIPYSGDFLSSAIRTRFTRRSFSDCPGIKASSRSLHQYIGMNAGDERTRSYRD